MFILERYQVNLSYTFFEILDQNQTPSFSRQRLKNIICNVKLTIYLTQFKPNLENIKLCLVFFRLCLNFAALMNTVFIKGTRSPFIVIIILNKNILKNLWVLVASSGNKFNLSCCIYDKLA